MRFPRTIPVLLLLAAAIWCAPHGARANVASDSSAVNPLDSLAPRVTVTAPVANALYLAGDVVLLRWVVTEANPLVGGSLQFAVVSFNDVAIDAFLYAPGDSVYEWNWTIPDVEAGVGQFVVTDRDSYGNGTTVASERFTVLPRGSAVEDGPSLRAALGPVSPNPFNPQTVIRLSLPESGTVSLDVHDVRGRRVRTLLRGDQPKGEREIVWDGTDDADRRLPGGMYLIRLAYPQDGRRETRVTKAVLLP